MNNAALKQRRKNIATAIDTGSNRDAVMRMFEVSEGTVRNACREFYVEFPNKWKVKSPPMRSDRCRKCGYIWTFLPRSGRGICEICMYGKDTP